MNRCAGVTSNFASDFSPVISTSKSPAINHPRVSPKTKKIDRHFPLGKAHLQETWQFARKYAHKHLPFAQVLEKKNVQHILLETPTNLYDLKYLNSPVHSDELSLISFSNQADRYEPVMDQIQGPTFPIRNREIIYLPTEESGFETTL